MVLGIWHSGGEGLLNRSEVSGNGEISTRKSPVMRASLVIVRRNLGGEREHVWL